MAIVDGDMADQTPLSLADLTLEDWNSTPERVKSLVHSLLAQVSCPLDDSPSIGQTVTLCQTSGALPMAIARVADLANCDRYDARLYLYEQIVSTTLDAVFVVDCDYVYQVVNSSYLTWYGRSSADVIGRSLSHILDPEQFQNDVKPNLDRCLLGEVVTEEGWHDYPTGRKFVSVTYVPYQDINGTISGAIVNVRDLTPLKHAELAMSKSDRRFRTLVENSTDVIVILDQAGIFCYASPSAQSVLGYSEADVCGKSALEFVHPDDVDVILQTIGSALSQPNVSIPPVEYRVRHHNGTWRFFEATTRNLLAEEAIAGIVVNCHDIGDRKIVETALIETRNKYLTLFETLPIGILVTDANGKFIEINPTSELIIGISNSELHQRTYESPEWHVLRPDLTPMPISEYACHRAVEENCLITDVEMIVARPQGDMRWINASAAPIPLDQYGAALAFVDVTEHKLAEAALRDSEERFRAFMDYSPAAAWVNDSEGRMEYVSQAYGRMFQVPTNWLGRSVFELYPPEIAQTYLDNIQTVAKSGQALEVVEPGIRADGRRGEFLVCRFSLPQPDGSRHVGGVAIDITEWRQAEAALHQREQEFRALAENSPDIITRFDRALRYLYINPAITVVTGLLSQAFIGKTNQELRMPSAQATLWDATLIRTFVTGKQQHLEFQLFTPEGMKDYQARCVPEFAANGSVVSVLVGARDITEQKQLERALRQRVDQEQAFSRVLQAIRQSLDLDIIFMTATVEIAQLVQTDRAAVVQYLPERQCWKHVSEYRRTLDIPDTLGTEIPDQGNLLAEQLKQFKVVRIDNPNIFEDEINQEFAQTFPGSWLLVPLIVDQKLWGSFSMVRSQQISPWTDEQAALVQTVAVQLAIAIQQAQAFEQAQTELAERQQAEAHLRAALTEKEVLLKEVHHRVKNNLQIVSGLLQLQAQSLTDLPIVNALKESQNRVDSMSLIHKKLYTSQDMGQVDVTDYIYSLACNLLTSYKISPSTVDLQVDVEPVTLSLDQAIPCGLVINELVSNSLKYAFPDNRPGKIYISLNQIGEELVLIIRDNGIGLPEHLDWEGNQSLGLSLVYSLAIDQLEGTLTVDSADGARFRLTFPLLTPTIPKD